MVPVPDAVSHKHAVVLPLKDAHSANGAVPGPGGLDGLAAGAELPSASSAPRSPRSPGVSGGGGVGAGLGGGQDDVARGGVGQPQPDKVAHDVDEEDGADGRVEAEGDRALAVEGGQDDVDLVGEGGRDHDGDEDEGADVGHLAREEARAAAGGQERHLGEGGGGGGGLLIRVSDADRCWGRCGGRYNQGKEGKRQGRKRRRQRAPWRLSIPRPLLSSLLHFSPANTSAQPQPLGQPGSSGGGRSRVGKSQGNTHLDLFSGKAFPFSAFLFSLLSPCACFLFHSLCFGLSAVRSDLKHS